MKTKLIETVTCDICGKERNPKTDVIGLIVDVDSDLYEKVQKKYGIRQFNICRICAEDIELNDYLKNVLLSKIIYKIFNQVSLFTWMKRKIFGY